MSAPICDIFNKCGVPNPGFLELLAACVVYQHDLAGLPVYALNTQAQAFACDDVHTMACGTTGGQSAEDILRLIFTCDCCGNLAVNINVTTCVE